MQKLVKHLVLSLVISCFLCSCSEQSCKISQKDGVTSYTNNGKGSNHDATIKVKKIFEINGVSENINDSSQIFTTPECLDVDSEGNIYILDKSSGTVKKFDQQGKFTQSFGGRGEGPGEMTNPIYLVIKNDTVVTYSIRTKSISKFTTSGIFINKLVISEFVINCMNAFDNNHYLIFKKGRKETENKVVLNWGISLLDNSFRTIGELCQNLINLDDFKSGGNNKYMNSFTHNSQSVFWSKPATDSYTIYESNQNGSLKSVITKPARTISYFPQEIEKIASINARFKKEVNMSGKFKQLIQSMYIDKDGRLLVCKGVDRKNGNSSIWLDIFKDGIFLNSAELDIIEHTDYDFNDHLLYFKDKRLFLLDFFNSKVVVFDYDTNLKVN